eukprot:GEMP01038030.1.p2 GENE.GEMP01038030.1~~GEMP01038030.1.p2  ORF type:complete len:212 (+),score=24.39 GEMP01038030.1:40-636(+)
MFGRILRARPCLGTSHRLSLDSQFLDTSGFHRLPNAVNAAPKRFFLPTPRDSASSGRQSLPNGVRHAWNRHFSGMVQLSEAGDSPQASSSTTRTGKCQLNARAKASQRTTLVERKSPLSAPEPWRRSLNLELNGENSAKNDQAVKEIMFLLQQCKDLEVLRLAETCSVSLIVRRPESEVWLGLSVKATTVESRKKLQF